MIGRGIDQILPHPCDPQLYESFLESAVDYIRLAEDVNGPIPRNVGFSYIWGAALQELARRQPDVRIINLETSITRSAAYEPKGINYRVSPENAAYLAAADIDCCVLANNHVCDWGRSGLLDTLAMLDHLQIKRAGAGRNLAEASVPAILEIPGNGRLLVFAFASTTSGVPRHWVARKDVPGVNLLPGLSSTTVTHIADQINRVRRPRDVVIVSVHWGPNWGYQIPDKHRRFARHLIETADVAIVHGHSSHHAKAIEIYRNRLILYGCGDFLNDYEGIRGYEQFRNDLALMYFVDVDPADMKLLGVDLVPLAVRRFRLIPARSSDCDWLKETLNRESQRFGVTICDKPDGTLGLAWRGSGGNTEQDAAARSRRKA
jgi:poly-gamma-glutamate synthesis protein (capsule biosynthesis protein)